MKKNKVFIRLMILLVTLVLALGLMPASAAGQPNVTKATRSYDIAVVFDNSGSMYNPHNDNMAWCQAKYAMEIFASMLDFDNGDKLTIFPMWKVVTDGSKPVPDFGVDGATVDDLADESHRVTVISEADVKKIHNLFTPAAGGTPFGTVINARKYLESSSADERWLIVLTDGIFLDPDNESTSLDADGTAKHLKDQLVGGIKVQYLPFNKNPKSAFAIDASRSDNENGFYSTEGVITTSDALQQEVIKVCNRIFQRDVLENRLSGNKLTLDLSMRRLIVFAQGDASVTLKDSKGTPLDTAADSGILTYSELAYGVAADLGREKYKVDTSLKGRVVAYADLAEGNYTLECSGTLQLFYEPDVTLKVDLFDKDNNPVKLDGDATVAPGDYRYEVSLIDRQTGKDVTNHELLGKDVKIETTLTIDGTEKSIKNGDTISLNPKSTVQVSIVGTYLTDYTITNKDDPSIFPLEFKTSAQDVLRMKATVEQMSKWYQLSQHDKWKPIRLDLTLNGEKLTDAQLGAVELKVEQTKGETLAYKTVPLPGKSAINVFIGYNDKGEYVKPEVGDCGMKFSATLPVEGGDPATASDSASFTVQAYPIWIWWAVAGGIFLFLLIVFLLFMSRKVLPRKMIEEKVAFYVRGRNIGGGNVHYDAKSRSITVKSIPVPGNMNAECQAKFTLYPIDNRWTPSKKRRVGFSDITGTSMGVTNVEIDGSGYVKKDGQFVTIVDGATVDEKTSDPTLVISTRTSHIDVSMIRL